MKFASVFNRAAQNMANALQSVYGESVTITPTTRQPNFMAQIDETLKPMVLQAIFTAKPVMGFSNRADYRGSGNRELDLAPAITTSTPRFTVRSCDLIYPIKPGYWISRTCFDNAVYEVTAINPDEIKSMIELSVNQLGRRTQLNPPSVSAARP